MEFLEESDRECLLSGFDIVERVVGCIITFASFDFHHVVGSVRCDQNKLKQIRKSKQSRTDRSRKDTFRLNRLKKLTVVNFYLNRYHLA
jgi:hypothetical protein